MLDMFYSIMSVYCSHVRVWHADSIDYNYVRTYPVGGIREYTADTGVRGVSRTLVTDRNVENSTEDSHNALMGYDLVFFRRNGPPELPSLLYIAQCV